MNHNYFSQKKPFLDSCPPVLYMYAMFALATLNCSLFSLPKISLCSLLA